MKLVSKKLLLIPAVAGLVLVPSVAMARQSADDTNKSNDVRREDRREDRRNDRNNSSQQGVDSRSDRANTVASGPQTLPKVDDNPSASDIAEGSATTGTPSSSSNSSSNSSNSTSTGEITVQQAKEIALRQHSGSTIRKTEVEIEHGVKVISVRFADGSRVDVSTKDGTVMRTEIESSRENDSSDDKDDDGDDDDRSNRGRR